MINLSWVLASNNRVWICEKSWVPTDFGTHLHKKRVQVDEFIFKNVINLVMVCLVKFEFGY